ncbi:ubiquinol-cytochrome c reductase iron-sulfur subunit [Allokutzneria sp. A3M-2-11 16]|uniref:cytochrome bc1 complex Rieske iron-sulfur subunit n=1 Tax=Allokutzneria sp. A3M-2-11 16 TaxID=2962043 RepID=UPI0020B69284|nr:ubiquinol-cytochrome c reductase iron-sulfur subunit [Allokutzneria sp. A3M-2-11 16]MCP3801791.1 ubiquinol-cytochrome c reductase iron-sulfur subunit [Allokutzneria sp. A3M-2-11 16]
MSEQQHTPGEAELAEMSRDELVAAGLEADHVVIAKRVERFPVPGTRAEKRAVRGVAAWFAVTAISGLAFLAVYVLWPNEYRTPDTPGSFWYDLYTPMLGLTLGLSVFALGIGVIAYAKKLLPDETAVQQRHAEGSTEFDKQTTAAILADSGATSGLARRKLITRSAGAAAGVFGLGVGVFALGGLVKNPWGKGDKSDLLVTGWATENGEKVFLRRDVGDPLKVSLVRPEDLDAGGFETVFPFKKSEEHDEHALIKGVRRSDSPVMLIRLRPGQKVVKRKGQEDFNYGDYYAYSKICTHLGCPTSLFEQQTGRLLCPCHQSQFDVFTYAKPIFGPATRSLPQLPITVDPETGYLIARGDFIEPIGPGYWERKS